jgi:hypothetical protein
MAAEADLEPATGAWHDLKLLAADGVAWVTTCTIAIAAYGGGWRARMGDRVHDRDRS